MLDETDVLDNAKADMDYWCKFTWLTIDQLTALSFGINPDIINMESIEKTPYQNFAKKYKNQYRLISQAPLNYKKRPPSSSIQMNILTAQLCPNQANLIDFIKWAINSGLNLPEAMVQQVDKIIPKNKGLETPISSETSLHTRAEETYLNIIGALFEYIAGEAPGIGKHPSYVNQTQLIEYLSEKYKGINGMSESNLSRKIPEAKNSLKK
jgi:hypothetical protein